MLEEGRNVWRIERATKLSVIVDGEDYFRYANEAMTSAEDVLLLIGWDFDPRIALLPRPDPDNDRYRLSHFIRRLADKRGLLGIYILSWQGRAIQSMARGFSIVPITRWWLHPRIHMRLDSAHPFGATHHQKIIVVDDCFAFCGGIDMTSGRWDTRDHLDNDERRHLPHAGPYMPWHDAATAIAGPAASALGAVARERWNRSGGEEIHDGCGGDHGWPRDLAVQFEDIEIGIARTYPKFSSYDGTFEIEQLYLDMIASAERYIYAESQYFASRRVAEAIAKRLEEPDGPEIVVINPLTAQGWLEPIVMDSARKRLVEALRNSDPDGRFRIYHPYTAGGEAIYVHAKILVVDDRILRVGSSNLNNRSMRLDSECDVVIDANRPANEGARPAIRDLTLSLLAEHLGVEQSVVVAEWDERGSLIGMIEALRGEGKTLRPYELPEINGLEEVIADNELLDPEGVEEFFEPFSKRGLFRDRLNPKRPWRRLRERRARKRAR